MTMNPQSNVPSFWALRTKLNFGMMIDLLPEFLGVQQTNVTSPQSVARSWQV
jgi:hypothetical protein